MSGKTPPKPVRVPAEIVAQAMKRGLYPEIQPYVVAGHGYTSRYIVSLSTPQESQGFTDLVCWRWDTVSVNHVEYANSLWRDWFNEFDAGAL